MFTKFNNQNTLILLTLLLCVYTTQVLSLKSDNSAPIHIEADQVDLDQNKGIARYRGNVRLVQGSININANIIQIYTKNGHMDYAKIHGSKNKLARFEQQTQIGKTISGEAELIIMQNGSSEIIFKGTATVNDGLNKISGAVIHHNTKQHKIIADNNGQKFERVKIIFLPTNNIETDKIANQPNQEQLP